MERQPTPFIMEAVQLKVRRGSEMRYETERLILRELTHDEAPLLAAYYRRNRDFFAAWEPERDESWYSQESARSSIDLERRSVRDRSGLCLHIFNKGGEQIIGRVALTNIVYGPFLSCFLGYKLDKDEINNGKMSEALRRVIEIAFDDYRLHRIEANIMPENLPSLRVVRKLGFVEEGLSRNYLKINGRWRDHLHYVLLNEKLE